MTFAAISDVDAWATKNGGPDAVKTSQARGDWVDHRTQKLVAEWLLLQKTQQTETARQSPEGLARRVADATELAAAASIESAKHAKASARWAMWAIVVAVSALLVAVLSK